MIKKHPKAIVECLQVTWTYLRNNLPTRSTHFLNNSTLSKWLSGSVCMWGSYGVKSRSVQFNGCKIKGSWFDTQFGVCSAMLFNWLCFLPYTRLSYTLSGSAGVILIKSVNPKTAFPVLKLRITCCNMSNSKVTKTTNKQRWLHPVNRWELVWIYLEFLIFANNDYSLRLTYVKTLHCCSVVRNLTA